MNEFTIKIPYLKDINKLTNNELGALGEIIAMRYMIKKKCQFIDKNVHFREGEIDLIFENDKNIIFIEVKTRRNQRFGLAYEQITGLKLEKVRKCITRYLNSADISKNPQIDIIGLDFSGKYIKITHFEDIF